MATAGKAGKEAPKELLEKLRSQRERWPFV